jgi:hypothetical protein
MNDHCTLTVVDEILDTKQVFELPTTVAEAAANCVEVMKARFFNKWFEHEELFTLRDDIVVPPEPIGVAIIQRADSITVTWHATGLEDDAVFRRQEILRGNWVRGGVDYDD